jgi:hypothetical protein
MQMGTVDAALQHSVRLVAIAAAGVLVGTLVLRTIDRITGGSLGESGFNPIAVGVASTLKPAAVSGRQRVAGWVADDVTANAAAALAEPLLPLYGFFDPDLSNVRSVPPSTHTAAAAGTAALLWHGICCHCRVCAGPGGSNQDEGPVQHPLL